MKYIFALLFIVLISSLNAHSDLIDEITVLTGDDFDQFITSNDLVLVEFFDPDCSFCRRFAAEFARLDHKLKTEASPIKMAKVDITHDRALAERYEIPHYPSLRFFTYGNPIPYKGENEIEKIIAWMDRKLQPSVQSIKTLEEIEELSTNVDSFAIFWAGSDQKTYLIYETASKVIEDIPFVTSNSQEVKDKFNPDNKAQVSIFRRFKNDVLHFEGELIFNDLMSFLLRNRLPEVQLYTPMVFERIFTNTKPGLFLILEKGEAGEKALIEYRKAAQQLKERKVEVVVGDVEDPITQQLTNFAGITQAMLPTVRLFQPTPGNYPMKYKLKGAIEAENIVRFFQDFEDKNLVEIVKSEPIPEKDEGSVRKVVGETFDDIVLDGTKDVLVEFYSPHCAACLEFAAEYESLAKRVETVKHLIIAKIDAYSNDIPNFPVTTYPQFKFFPARVKENPINYDGELNADSMLAFLKRKANWSKWPKNSDEL